MKKKVAVLSGAGISAESGISTFRDADGLWEGHDVMDVASPQGWARNRKLVLEFYNQRRKQALEVNPNAAHLALVELEQYFDVTIITQNVDNLHERAGSSNIIHLHGELFKSRSTKNANLIFDIDGWELNIGDLCPQGSQLRPNIVWFGEMVPEIERAAKVISKVDYLLVVGTSLAVYPAAGLIDYAGHNTEIYVIDPHIPYVSPHPYLHKLEEKATTGVRKVVDSLITRLES